MTEPPDTTPALDKFEAALDLLSTEKQRLYVRGYIVHLNQKEAAAEAGYAEASARTSASHNMKNPLVRAAIRAGMEELAERTGLSAAWIRYALLRTGRKAYKAGNCSLELIAKLMGLFEPDVNLNVSLGGVSEVVFVMPDNGRGPASHTAPAIPPAEPRGKD